MRALTVGLFAVLAGAGEMEGCREAPPTPLRPRTAPEVRSQGEALDEAPAQPENIMPADYVGPEACADCHPDAYQAWKRHPHSRMNQDASARTVLGDFSGGSVEYGGVRTVFEREGDTFFMSHRIAGDRGAEVLLRRDRITRTIGSKQQQAYVGIQVEGPEPPDHPLYSTERALPYVYWFSRAAWFPEHFVEQYPEPEYDDEGELRYPTSDPYSRGHRPWTEGCLLCHNTYPYAFRVGRAFPGPGFEGVAARAGPGPLLSDDPTAEDLVTLGVSCESCHFGGREHVTLDRGVHDRPMSASLVPIPAGNGGRAVTSICAQCHVAGTLPYPNGASSVNSSEALDMLRGNCASTISCADCHDPHLGHVGDGEPASVDAFADRACVRCHPQFEAPQARDAHTRHGPQQAGCVDCHMAPITQGIDAVVRSHRIDSPTNRDMIAEGAPNACNLCHPDRSLGWTLAELERGWGAMIDAADGWHRRYGAHLQTPLGEVWLRHDTPVHRLVAADAISRRRPSTGALRQLLPMLLDPYPQNRMFGLFAIERVLGRRLSTEEYQPTDDRRARQRQVRRLERALLDRGGGA